MNNKYLYYLADLPKIGNFRNKTYLTYYVNESDPRSNVHYLGSSENKA